MTYHSVTWCNFRGLILLFFEVGLPKFKYWWNRAWAECCELMLKVTRDMMFWLAMTFNWPSDSGLLCVTGLCCCAQHCDQRRFFPPASLLLNFGSGRRRCCCELASPLRGGRLKCDPKTPTPCRASDGCLQLATNSALGTTCCQSVCAMGTPCDVSVGHGNPVWCQCGSWEPRVMSVWAVGTPCDFSVRHGNPVLCQCGPWEPRVMSVCAMGTPCYVSVRHGNPHNCDVPSMWYGNPIWCQPRMVPVCAFGTPYGSSMRFGNPVWFQYAPSEPRMVLVCALGTPYGVSVRHRNPGWGAAAVD